MYDIDTFNLSHLFLMHGRAHTTKGIINRHIKMKCMKKSQLIQGIVKG